MDPTNGLSMAKSAPDYGNWKNTHIRFFRWKAKKVWGKLLEIFIKDPDYEWLMIDAIFSKCYIHAVGARGDTQERAVSKGAQW
jgi:hypothetical protein